MRAALLRALRYAVERKHMEEALFAEKERAQVTLNCIGDAVVCTDIAGKRHLPQCRRGKIDGLVAGRKRQAGRWPTSCKSWTPRVAKPPRIRWRWQSSRTEPCTCRRTASSSGATDLKFRSKTPSPPSMTAKGRSTGAVIVFRDVSAARAMALQMAHSAEHDFLTGLPNRMLLNDRVGQAIAAGAAPRETGRGAVSGSGRLQAHQRFPGTSDRRQASSIRRQAPGGLRARLGHGEPAGRR